MTGDGIHGMAPEKKMCKSSRKLRDIYKIKPDAPFYQKEFGFLSLDAWKKQEMPEDVPLRELFGFDEPELIHDCMKTWLKLADAVISKHQEQITLDELFIAEDICYNKGPLISPGMIKEFLFPYYRQLIGNIKSRQLDKNRHLYFQVDTDGYVLPIIPLYMDIGMDVMSPFEAASGCDVLEIGKAFP